MLDDKQISSTAVLFNSFLFISSFGNPQSLEPNISLIFIYFALTIGKILLTQSARVVVIT